MSAQPNLMFTRQSAAMLPEAPHPAALEAIGLIEQSLAELLLNLRGHAGADAADSPGAIEYASWLAPQRPLHR